MQFLRFLWWRRLNLLIVTLGVTFQFYLLRQGLNWVLTTILITFQIGVEVQFARMSWPIWKYLDDEGRKIRENS